MTKLHVRSVRNTIPPSPTTFTITSEVYYGPGKGYHFASKRECILRGTHGTFFPWFLPPGIARTVSQVMWHRLQILYDAVIDDMRFQFAQTAQNKPVMVPPRQSWTALENLPLPDEHEQQASFSIHSIVINNIIEPQVVDHKLLDLTSLGLAICGLEMCIQFPLHLRPAETLDISELS
ncbi:hypothetical protein K474DRAFT_1675724 [Panus rudis PR-1116 ss-1]|nr:hypothetical protein K474DRAFT_1675724 [Panus rudis PR-1116 ss-1]